jgi:hypothetical protein
MIHAKGSQWLRTGVVGSILLLAMAQGSAASQYRVSVGAVRAPAHSERQARTTSGLPAYVGNSGTIRSFAVNSGETIQVCTEFASPVSTGPGPDDFECVCWAGYKECGFECISDGEQCGDSGDSGSTNPEPPDPPQPPGGDGGDLTCTEEGLGTLLTRAEEDYADCIGDALNSAGTKLWFSLVAAPFAAAAGNLVLAGEVAIMGTEIVHTYGTDEDRCKREFCKTVKRTIADCNLPVPDDPPDDICDPYWD